MALARLIRKTWEGLFGTPWGPGPDPPIQYVQDVVRHSGLFAQHAVDQQEWVVRLACEAWRRGFEARGVWDEQQFALQSGDVPPYMDAPGYAPEDEP